MDGTLPEEADENALYPEYAPDFVPEHPGHERQVRYLRDALTVLMTGYEVTGNRRVLGWDGEQTLYIAPDVLAYYEEARGIQPLPPNPHPNRHPGERGRRFELAVDVTGRYDCPKQQSSLRPELLTPFGLGAYVHFDAAAPQVTAWRLVDNKAVRVPSDARGRFFFADLRISFGLDAEGFLRVYDIDGRLMPRYEEAVPRIVSLEERSHRAMQEDHRRGQ